MIVDDGTWDLYARECAQYKGAAYIVEVESQALREEIERLRTENDRFRTALEIIADGAANKLQRIQAIGALANIGPDVER